MENNNNDFMKYWRVIRYYIKAKYGLTQADLDMLLFLKSEGFFSKNKFDEFNEILSWEVNRFDKLKRDDWIVVVRPRGKEKALYGLSFKAKHMITSIYKKLNGEVISETSSKNPIFLRKVNYNHKVYRNFIKSMNKELKERKKKDK